MTLAQVEQLSQALLYEGYALYPYRASALKNQHRWTFGCLLPRSYCERHAGADDWHMQTQCLVVGGSTTGLEVQVRLLHVRNRVVGKPVENAAGVETIADFESDCGTRFRPVEMLEIDGKRHCTWQDAVERTVTLTFRFGRPLQRKTFVFPASRDVEPLGNSHGELAGALLREQKQIEVAVEVGAESLGGKLFKLTLRICNTASDKSEAFQDRDHAVLQSLASVHAILNVVEGEFVSLLDPPASYGEAAASCHNRGTFPVLVGAAGTRNMMLSSPIILYDYPQVAPESCGDLYDGTEIDELLSLRIQTLTAAERHEASSLDDRVRNMVDRTNTLGVERLQSLHGAVRDLRVIEIDGGAKPIADQPPDDMSPLAAAIQPGDRVRLQPHGRADAIDLLLEGKTAVVESVQEDWEGNRHIAVTLDDDPGRDLGMAGMPGHRFFFRRHEVELL